jgi:hypothetical protein
MYSVEKFLLKKVVFYTDFVEVLGFVQVADCKDVLWEA